MRYVAFLRAINVGGHVVKMERLRQLFGEMGYTDVETFIASGNVIFSTTARSAARLETKIEGQLEAALGYPVETFLRTLPEVAAIAAHQPFPLEPAGSVARTYVMFLRDAPSAAGEQALLAHNSQWDQFQVRARELYWLNRRPPGDTTIPGPQVEKAVRGPVTVRNITTVRRLSAKYPAGR
jgi:uncharacterized protein (DUF1697 family)